eukprot:UN18670
MKFISSRFSHKKRANFIQRLKTKNDPAIPAVQNISDIFLALQKMLERRNFISVDRQVKSNAVSNLPFRKNASSVRQADLVNYFLLFRWEM